MNVTGVLSKLVAPGVIMALMLNSFAYGQQQSSSPAVPESTQSTSSQSPDNSAGTSQNSEQTDEQLPDTPSSLQSQPSVAEQPVQQPQAQVTQAQPQQVQPQNAPHEPLGTAAAPNVPTSGIAASRPAGAALAPAKQRRIRSILIKVGAIAGVGVAIGATMALTKGSPSTPPGAR